MTLSLDSLAVVHGALDRRTLYFRITSYVHVLIIVCFVRRHEHLSSCLHAEQEASKKSSVSWLKTVLSSGTVADKTAALVLTIQEAPLHSLASLDTVMTMVKKSGGRSGILKTLGLNYLQEFTSSVNQLLLYELNAHIVKY